MKSSVIIPTAGRPIAIKAAIRSLLALSPDQYETEILVVDNNTQEDLAKDLLDYCVSLHDQVRYIREPNPGLSAARHRGIEESRGHILTFIDDDVEVSSGWLKAIHKGFEDPEVGMVGGPSIPNFTASVPAWFWDFFSSTPYGGWMCSWLSLLDIGHDVKGIDPNYIWGLNFSIRKDVALQCRGFHPDLVPSSLQRWQGDGETGLTMKVAAAGYRADYLQQALLFHLCGPDRLNEQYFAKRAYYQGVCDSFTRIRAGDTPISGSTPGPAPTVYRRVRKHVGIALRRLQGRGSTWRQEGASVRMLTDKAYLDGWRFHQTEVAADPKLLAWIRREDFWNSDIRKEKK